FTPEEVGVALELVDAGLAARAPAQGEADGYRFWLDVERHAADAAYDVRGYVCYGRTPMTRGTFDMYWLAVAPTGRGRGVGRELVRRMESDVRSEGGYLVRVETAGTEDY